MRFGRLAILLTACGSAPPRPDPTPVQPARLLAIADLERLGATVTPIDATESLVEPRFRSRVGVLANPLRTVMP